MWRSTACENSRLDIDCSWSLLRCDRVFEGIVFVTSKSLFSDTPSYSEAFMDLDLCTEAEVMPEQKLGLMQSMELYKMASRIKIQGISLDHQLIA